MELLATTSTLAPRLAAAIRAADANELKRKLDAKQPIALAVDGGEISLGPDDLIVEVHAKEGFAAASAGIGVVVLDIKLTDELVEEGLYREVLNRIQTLRKELNLDYQARIRLAVSGDAALVGACRSRAEALAKETLANEVVFDTSIEGERRAMKVIKHELVLELVDLGVPTTRSGSGTHS